MVPNISRLTKNIFALVVYLKKRNAFLGIDDPIYHQFNEKFIQDLINKDQFNFHNLIWNKHAILLKDLNHPQYFIKEYSNHHHHDHHHHHIHPAVCAERLHLPSLSNIFSELFTYM